MLITLKLLYPQPNVIYDKDWCMIEATPVSKALGILYVHNIVEVIRFSCNVQWE